MHIIFGKDNALELENKYTLLELDLIQIGSDGPVLPAYCVIENMSILDLPRVDSMKRLHENLISGYRNKDWKYCQDSLEHLQGFWGGEVDSFYADIGSRVKHNMENPPSDEWTPVIRKT
jgi:hypothetical protein